MRPLVLPRALFLIAAAPPAELSSWRSQAAKITITRDDFGIDDAWPVFCEDFIQWVVEDEFTAGRPAFEEVGGAWTGAAMLQPLSVMLDLAGEAMRARLVVVQGEGEELALRPDFTIALARAHNAVQAQAAHLGGAGPV